MDKNIKKTRLSNKKKSEIVLEVLRGVSIEELSRTNKVAVYQINQWRDKFIQQGTASLHRQRKDTKVSELERIIGRQQMEIELLKKKKTLYGNRHENI
jgi:transposase-like protein